MHFIQHAQECFELVLLKQLCTIRKQVVVWHRGLLYKVGTESQKSIRHISVPQAALWIPAYALKASVTRT